MRRARGPYGWIALGTAGVAAIVWTAGSSLATRSLTGGGCHEAPHAGTGGALMAVAIVVLSPAVVVLGLMSLWRGSTRARVASAVGVVVVAALWLVMYRNLTDWTYQCGN